MKKYSTSLIIRETQIKTMMRYYPTPVRVVIIKKIRNKCWRGCRENEIIVHCWWECKLVQSLWKTVWKFLKKLKVDLPNDLAIPLPGIHLEKIMIRKDTCTQCSLQHYFQDPRHGSNLNVHQSTDEWIKKMWYVCVCVCVCVCVYIIYIYVMEYYSAIKKNKIMPFAATWMDLEIIILSEVSQRENDKYYLTAFICGI